MGNTIEKGFEAWAVIELFGHQRIAGRVTEASIGGCNFLRVDVPNGNGGFLMTKFFGNGAIYGMTPVEESVAKTVAGHLVSKPPVYEWEMPKQLPGNMAARERGGDAGDVLDI